MNRKSTIVQNPLTMQTVIYNCKYVFKSRTWCTYMNVITCIQGIEYFEQACSYKFIILIKLADTFKSRSITSTQTQVWSVVRSITRQAVNPGVDSSSSGPTIIIYKQYIHCIVVFKLGYHVSVLYTRHKHEQGMVLNSGSLQYLAISSKNKITNRFIILLKASPHRDAWTTTNKRLPKKSNLGVNGVFVVIYNSPKPSPRCLETAAGGRHFLHMLFVSLQSL